MVSVKKTTIRLVSMVVYLIFIHIHIDSSGNHPPDMCLRAAISNSVNAFQRSSTCKLSQVSFNLGFLSVVLRSFFTCRWNRYTPRVQGFCSTKMEKYLVSNIHKVGPPR